VVVDRATTVQLASSAVRAPGPDAFDLPAATTPQPIGDEEITSTAAQVERALAEPLLLRPTMPAWSSPRLTWPP
jgi:hypothetical protein